MRARYARASVRLSDAIFSRLTDLREPSKTVVPFVYSTIQTGVQKLIKRKYNTID